MFIYNFDGSWDGLRFVLINDLRDLSIRLPKGCRKYAADSTKMEESRNGLLQHCTCSLESMSCVEVEGFGLVPRFLVKAVKLLDDGLETEGLFRKSASGARVKDLQARLAEDEEVDSLNPLDVAELIKRFIRELPQPLLTSHIQQSLLLALQGGDRVEGRHDGGGVEGRGGGREVEGVLKICLLLPYRHISVLRYIMDLLHRVSLHQDINKMTTSNLATCLCPSLFHFPPTADLEYVKTIQEMQTRVMEILIDESERIGEISDELCERVVSSDWSAQGDDVSLSDDDDEDYDEDDDDVSASKRESRSGKKRSGSIQGWMGKWRNKWRSSSKEKQCTSISAGVTAAAEAARVARQQAAADAAREKAAIAGAEAAGVARHKAAVAAGQAFTDMTTPVLVRKRKAEDGVAFSAGRKKAVLKNMPNMSALGGTSATPAALFKDRGSTVGDSMFSSPVSLTFCDSNQSTSYSISRPGDTSVNSIGDSTVNNSLSSKSKVRRSIQGIIRRLSGSKEPAYQRNSSQEDQSESIGGYVKVCRSPSAPNMGGARMREGPEAMGEGSRAGRSRKREEEPRKRSVSEDPVTGALKRGRPNTVRSGLPSPLHRRASAVSTGSRAERTTVSTGSRAERTSRHVDVNKSGSVTIIGTSPIAVDVNQSVSIIDTSPISGVGMRAEFNDVPEFDLNADDISPDLSRSEVKREERESSDKNEEQAEVSAAEQLCAVTGDTRSCMITDDDGSSVTTGYDILSSDDVETRGLAVVRCRDDLTYDSPCHRIHSSLLPALNDPVVIVPPSAQHDKRLLADLTNELNIAQKSVESAESSDILSAESVDLKFVVSGNTEGEIRQNSDDKTLSSPVTTPHKEGIPKIKQPLLANVVTKRLATKSGTLNFPGKAGPYSPSASKLSKLGD